MKELLGSEIQRLWVSKDDHKLYFGQYYNGIGYVTDGDCCSETWFADIIGVKNILGQQIIGVEILDVPKVEDGRTRQEVDEFYGYRLKTKKGVCDIIFRNSSNGYYGGSIGCVEDMKLDDEFVEITDDWQATGNG